MLKKPRSNNMNKIARISLRVAGFELDGRLFTQRTARNAADFLSKTLSKYTHDVYNNEDKKYKELYNAKNELFQYGMNLESKEEHTDVSDNGSWKDLYHFSFRNFEGKEFTICVEFNVMLAGTTTDHELSYDFTVQAWDENKETQYDAPAINHEIASMPRPKACKAIQRMVDKYTHDVYDNKDYRFTVLQRAHQIVDSIGMESLDCDRKDFRNDYGDVTGYTEVDTYRYLDANLKEVKLSVRWSVYYAGSIGDIKNRYDFTVDVY